MYFVAAQLCLLLYVHTWYEYSVHLVLPRCHRDLGAVALETTEGQFQSFFHSGEQVIILHSSFFIPTLHQ
jgi:hypothetical protein